jgi:aspartyl-tRNA(Asn)/glutamyl-tRNA(Gln) amidotransferase subunit A
MKDLEFLLQQSLEEAAAKIEKREISPVELVKAQLDRIEREDQALNSYITVNSSGAMEEAEKCEQEIASGIYRGPLHGIPIGLKDLIDTADMKTTYGSGIYENHMPKEDAEVVKLLKKAGAIIIGKLNTHQFAYGPTGDRSHAGPVKNPFNHAKITGGSSSGSAAAVAAGLSFGTLGTDTGGSVRIPAAFCGVVGMKPTYGRVSTKGVFPLSSTFDHVGPLTRTMKDNALLLNALIENKEDFTQLIGQSLKGKVIGIESKFYFDNVHPQVESAILKAIDLFKGLGVQIVDVDMPNMTRFSEAHKVILRSEAYAVHEQLLKDFPDQYDDEVKERLLTALETTGFDFVKALKDQERAKQGFNHVLDRVDVLISPTISILPPDINSRYTSASTDESKDVRWIITKLTGPTNLNGLPSLSVPCGFSKDGLPIGLQLIGREHDEAALYQFGYALEKELSLKPSQYLQKTMIIE